MTEYVLKLAKDENLRESLVRQAQKDIEQYASENVHKVMEEILEKYICSGK